MEVTSSYSHGMDPSNDWVRSNTILNTNKQHFPHKKAIHHVSLVPSRTISLEIYLKLLQISEY